MTSRPLSIDDIEDGDTISGEDLYRLKGLEGELDEPVKPKVERKHPERDFQEGVAEEAKLAEWPPHLTYHTFDSRGSQRGYPDLSMAWPEQHRGLKAELKVTPNKPRQSQILMLEAWDAVEGVECYLWYPEDRDEIISILGGYPSLDFRFKADAIGWRRWRYWLDHFEELRP